MTIKIYVASLEAYNQGRMVGDWLTPSDYLDFESFNNAIQVATKYADEVAVHDYEGVNLNDEYQGGDLIFTDQKNIEIKRFKLDKGSVVFFPSNFMYPHMIEPLKKGKRYSIVAWLQ